MILQVRLKGSSDGQFQNIDIPFEDMAEFAAVLDEGEIVVCDRLFTRAVDGGKRKIISRTDIGVTREGIDWLMTPTIEFTEGEG